MPRAALAVLAVFTLVGCARPPRSSPAATSAHPSSRAALRPGKSFTVEMWTPQRADLVAHAPLAIEWVSCSLRNGLDGELEKVSCASATPAPEKLDPSLRASLARCYEVVDRPGSKATVLSTEQQYLPDAKEVVTAGEVIALTQTIDNVLEVPVTRTEEAPSILATPVVPTKYPPITFSIAVPEYTSSDGVTLDWRFAVPTDGRSDLAVANELATRLDGLDLAAEESVVLQAYWIDRALIAMIRRDRGALDVAYEGLERISGGTDSNSWARSTAYTLGQVRERGLVFDDPCR